MSNQGSVPVVRQPPPEGCGTWATARRTQPCSGGPCCHVPRLPAPPRPSRVPLRLRLRCVRLCAGGPGGAHPAGRPPDDQTGPNPVTTSLSAALSALELGHRAPPVADITAMAPPPPAPLAQTVTAPSSQHFATLSTSHPARARQHTHTDSAHP